MLYKDILSSFENRLYEIKITSSNILEEASSGYALCNEVLGQLKKDVETNGFKNRDLEIHFFKSIKVEPMKYLIFYTEVRSCELRMPKFGEKQQIKFLQKQIDKVNTFFNGHTEFLIYMDQDYRHFDKQYFTRKHVNSFPPVEGYPYFKDATFNTSHDSVLARIKGYGLYVPYLIGKRKALENGRGAMDNTSNGKVKWTGSYAAFIEFVYGCQAMGYFNNGNIELKTLIKELGDFLKVQPGNPFRTYNEIKNRKSSRIKFFEETGKKLLEKMDREDGIKE